MSARTSSSSSSTRWRSICRERAQAHVEDRVGLALAELEALHQLRARLRRVLGEPRMIAITSSRWSSAIAKPSRMWARASAWARS